MLIPEDDQWPTTTALSGTVGLWVRGQADLAVLSAEMVCVTGARAASSYGTHVAADLAGGLAARGYAVVAGASFGIEAAAHRGALAGRGTTVAVLSCGIDRAYPVAHENLLERIAQEQDDGRRLTPALTHQQIADMIGASRETVTRAVKELKQSGGLEQQGKRYLVP